MKLLVNQHYSTKMGGLPFMSAYSLASTHAVKRISFFRGLSVITVKFVEK